MEIRKTAWYSANIPIHLKIGKNKHYHVTIVELYKLKLGIGV